MHIRNVGAGLVSSAAMLVAAWLSLSGTALADAQSDQIARGQYLTEMGGCASCHTTAGGGGSFAGGLAMKLPMGTIYTPNITPDKETGIGNWSDDDFVRAMHEGIGKNGDHLYPAFPYTSFSLMTNDDVLAIKAYLFAQPAVHYLPPENSLAFPYNVRSLMSMWNVLFASGHPFQPDPGQSADWNRGAYLVQAVGHCGECHTPRNGLTQAMETGSQFGGGEADGWTAYNITSDATGGIGGWSEDDLAHYLTTGAAPGKGWATGPMGLVVEDSTRFLTPADLRAVMTYLRTVPPIKGNAQAARFALGDQSGQGNAPTIGQMPGSHTFDIYCANCHGSAGLPETNLYPTMAHESSVGANRARNLIMVILQGAHGMLDQRATEMPSFARKFDDKQIADLVNYLVTRYGDPAASVTEADVAKGRAQ